MKKDSLEKKIAAYVTLAAAYMAAHPVDANAQIMYTDVNLDIVIGTNENYFLDLNNDGVNDFKLELDVSQIGGYSSTSQFHLHDNAIPLGQNELVTVHSSSFNNNYFPVPVGQGDIIDSLDEFTISPILFEHIETPTSFNTYGYCEGLNEIIGLKLVSGGVTHYGWMRLKVSTYEIVLKDYAVNLTPDEPIIAGDTINCDMSQVTTNPTSQGWICIDSLTIGLVNASGDTYQWLNNLQPIAGATDSVYTTGIDGSYGVLVSDSSCALLINSLQVNFVPLNAPMISASQINEHCNGANGSITLYSAFEAPNTYLWSNGATTQNLQNLTAGNYTVTVTACNGNIEITPFTIINTPSLSESHTNSCNNDIGTIDLSVTGNSFYSYSWSNGFTTQDLHNLMPGTYSVTVTDFQGCVVGLSVNILDSLGFTLSENHPDTICHPNDGYIEIAIDGGIPNYNYQWNNGSTSQNLTGVTSGIYSVVVTDGNGCSATINAVIADSVAIPVISFQNAILYSSYAGKNQWYLNSLSNPLQGDTLDHLNPPENGYYWVEVIYPNGCSNISDKIHVGFVSGTASTELPFISFEINNKKLLFHLTDKVLMGAQIDIVNELGQLAASVTVTSQTPGADLSALPGGIYFYHIRSKQKTYSGKFIID